MLSLLIDNLKFELEWGDHFSKNKFHEDVFQTNLGFIPSNCFFFKFSFENKGVILEDCHTHMPNPTTAKNYHLQV
jgi:hypothetical protein